MREKILGHEHPDTITARAWLGDILQKKGDYVKAEPVLREVAESRKKVQGPSHPEYASALNNLAWLLKAQVRLVGLAHKAREIWKYDSPVYSGFYSSCLIIRMCV